MPQPRQPRWQDRRGRKARAAQLKREPWCEICRDQGIGATPAVEVDHIVPRCEGGSLTDPANLMSLCWDHHQDKTAHDRARRTGRPVRRKVRIDPDTGLPLPGQDHPWSECPPGGMAGPGHPLATRCRRAGRKPWRGQRT